MAHQFFVGLDLGKSSIEANVRNEKSEEIRTFSIENEAGAIHSALLSLQKDLGFAWPEVIFCLEHTGIYGNPVVAALAGLGAKVWVEHAERIQKSTGLQRGKNDPVDARRIAQFAVRFVDQARFYEPSRPVIDELSALWTLRERLVGIKNQLEVPLKEAEKFMKKHVSSLLKSHSQSSQEAVNNDIKAVDAKMKELFDQDDDLCELYKLVSSVPGIGKATAAAIIITTNEFKKFDDPKKFACHAGFAPFEHRSGTSIRGKTKTSKKANSRLKKLIHMGAMSILTSKSSLKQFYEHKKAQGKHHLVALHALGNKLIRIVFAVVEKRVMYQKDFNNSLAKP